MKRISSIAVFFLVLSLLTPLDSFGKPSSSGSSTRPSSGFSTRPSSGFSTRPSSGFSGGSKPSTPKSNSGFSGGSKPSTPKSNSGFSGGSKPSTPKSNSGFSGGSNTPNNPNGVSTFSGGSKPAQTQPTKQIEQTPKTVSKKPTTSIDKAAAVESKKVESRSNYERSKASSASTTTPPTFKTASGAAVKIDRDSKPVVNLRNSVTTDSWNNRPTRTTVFYNSYNTMPVMHYSDPYHHFWNYWLLSQTIDTMAMWTYHHRNTMDPSRLEHLYSQNADLRARVAALESSKTPVDPNWVPANVDTDVQYSDEYVKAVVNPTPAPIPAYAVVRPSSGISMTSVIVTVIFIIAICGVLYYLVFVREYDV